MRWWIVPLLLMSSVVPLLGAEKGAASKGDYQQRYGVLAERNIFLKDRTKSGATSRPSDSTATTRESPKPIIELGFVLTGIVKEEGQYRAYVEDAPNTKVLRLNVGDAVAAGKISGIEIDAVTYEVNGQAVRVEVGCDLTGAPFNALAASTIGSGASTAPAAPATSVNVNSANLSVEERMRLRRAQELNRK